MKKLLALMFIIVLTASGCTKSGQYETRTEDGKILLSVGNWPDPHKNPEEYAEIMQRKAEFETINPDIYIEPDYWCYDVESFTVKAEGGTLPILWNTFGTELGKITEAGYAADVTYAMRKYGYAGMMSDEIENEVTFDGKMYFIPTTVYTMGLAVNLELMKEAGMVEDDEPIFPESFAELREMARTVKEKTGKAGFVFPTTGNGGGWCFTNLAWSFGGRFTQKDKDGWHAVYGSDEVSEALEFLQNMMWEDGTLPLNTLINNDDVARILATGEAAMCLAHPGQISVMVSTYGMDIEDVGFAKIPAGPARRVALLGGGYNAISSWATEEQIEAAFRWMDFCGQIPTFELEDDKKVRMEENFIAKSKNRSAVIGIIDQPVWDSADEARKYRLELIERYKNVNEKNIASYNDKNGVEYQTEEPIKAQSLYSLLDSCIQEVLTNKDAVALDVLKNSAAEFQKSYLDGVK